MFVDKQGNDSFNCTFVFGPSAKLYFASDKYSSASVHSKSVRKGSLKTYNSHIVGDFRHCFKFNDTSIYAADIKLF